MFQEFVAVVQSIGATFVKLVPVSVALGAVFAALTFFWRAIPVSHGGASARSRLTSATGSLFRFSRAICASGC
jgi:hypothetical protein